MFRPAKAIREQFAEMVSRDDETIDLGDACLLIAVEEYPRLDASLYLEKLDRIGDLARERASGAESALDFIAALNATLFDELRFQGNTENYYDPRNSYLNQVIDRRTGIPITLTVIYMEVARRIGFAVNGVGLPGHFIACSTNESGTVFIDVFNGGRLLGEASCADLVASVSGGKLELKPHHLEPVTRKQLLTRILSNILAIYSGATDYRRALAAIDRILLINPDSASHIRDRGFLLAAADEPAAALLELERYLAFSPTADDVEDVQEQMKTIRQNQAKLN